MEVFTYIHSSLFRPKGLSSPLLFYFLAIFVFSVMPNLSRDLTLLYMCISCKVRLGIAVVAALYTREKRADSSQLTSL